jgi:hypothetical protein
MSSTRDRKKADRERKAAEREARRKAGIPEPQLLDKILVDSLRDCVVIGLGHPDRPDPVVQSRFKLRELMQRALRDLGRRGYDKRACVPLIAARLAPVDGAQTLPPVPQAARPVSQVAELKTEPPERLAPSGHDASIQAMLDDLTRTWAPENWVPESEEAQEIA